MYKPALTMAVGAILSAGIGCGDRDNEIHVHYDREVGHVCTRACNHYYDGGKLIIFKKGHVHGPDCGHRWDGKHWVIVKVSRRSAAPPPHVCTRACNHYYDGGKLIVFKKGHRHGPNCGHEWDGKHWVLAKLARAVASKRHVCTRACDEHYWDKGKLVVIKGHHHGPNCGHRWNGEHWVLTMRARLKGRGQP